MSWQRVKDGDAIFLVGFEDWVTSYGNKEGVSVQIKAKYGRKVKMCTMLGLVMN